MNNSRRPLRLPTDEIPETLQAGPHVGRCGRCDAIVIWTQRDDVGDEINTPIYPESKKPGNLIIIGFTRRGNEIEPIVADVRYVDELPDWDSLPAWTRGKRWLHHSPECAGNTNRTSLRRIS